MLVVFEKGEPLRHIGHLDLMRAMQRILRRTGLPVAYSQGFNPHMVINFAAPLSVGASGLREIMDVALASEVTGEDFLSKLNDALPPALKAVASRAVLDTYPAPMSRLFAATYEMKMENPAGGTLAQAIPGFLKKSEIPAMRKTKSGEKPCDIKPMIYELKSLPALDGCHVLTATLALREEAACKPEMLLTALSESCGMECPPYSLVRTCLWGKGPDGELKPLESL
jgi:radical SAM-linked protein